MMTKLIYQNYALRFFGFLSWGIGMGVNSPYIYPLIPIGTLLFFLGVILGSMQNSNGIQDDNPITITISNFLEEYFYFAFKAAVWLVTIVLLFAMPITSIMGFNKIIDDINWNSTQSELDINPILDLEFGVMREYSSPEWLVEDSTVRIAKIFTNGESAYGSFILVLDSNNGIINIDSLIVEME